MTDELCRDPPAGLAFWVHRTRLRAAIFQSGISLVGGGLVLGTLWYRARFPVGAPGCCFFCNITKSVCFGIHENHDFCNV